MKQKIKLSEWAKLNSYTYRGAFNLYQRGQIPGLTKTESGALLVEIEDGPYDQPECNVVYARVSSSENKKNLETQADRVCQFCAAKGWVVHTVIKECASGLNDERPKLQKILKENKATKLIVEHKDRLTRFGFEYLKTLFGGEIVVINEVTEDEQDLMQDFISLVTSFCARLYGRRRSRRKTEKLIEGLKHA